MTNSELLRKIADFCEEYPDFPLPTIYPSSVSFHLEPETAKEFLRSLGSFEKHYYGNFFNATKKIDGVTYEFWVARDAVCKRVVKGTRHVEATIRPAELIPEHEEELIEWECEEPILADTEDVEIDGVPF